MSSRSNSFSLGRTDGGDLSIEARLRTVRNSLENITQKIRDLDRNMIFLITRPEMVSVLPQGNSSAPPLPVGHITDPGFLYDQITEGMSSRRDLMVEEEELLSILKREKNNDEFNKIKNHTGDESPIQYFPEVL